MHQTTRSGGLSRRGFMGIAAVGVAATTPAAALARRGERQRAVQDDFPSQDYESVRETVGASHGNLARVTELVEARPALAKAAIDWGFGDWETALGAASHVGNRAIAELLMAHGARPDVFTCAMMGWVDAVRGMVSAQPGVQRLYGPHGFTLAHHARVGGDESAAVREYLDELGDADRGYERVELDEAAQQVYVGTYTADAGLRLGVFVNRFGLAIRREEGTPRTLIALGGHAFHPVGAESVRVVFGVEDGSARTVTVHDPDPIVQAQRVDG